ncbi:unnamed protein product [Didymodactylos carnosus]|uniref:Uncharacterized protein n=1 Tax=Didymodactylos carnosus TaxID=1234261 RepID=A0A8S2IAS9_9BILA|nr:unnamed protein product [Didymodactylos carnosus]CAF3736822.1 unnamed protein product [Didymodactylos carnosus]
MIHSTLLHPESSLSTQTSMLEILSSAAVADTSTTTITTTSTSRVAITITGRSCCFPCVFGLIPGRKKSTCQQLSKSLTIAYPQNDEIRICSRKLLASALLPLDKIEWKFHDLCTKPPATVKQTLHQLFLYFEKQWMTDVPLEIWNVHGYSYRTNNNCADMSVSGPFPSVYHLSFQVFIID